MQLGKFTTRAIIEGYNFLPGGDMKTLAERADETKYWRFNSTLKIFNRTAYN